MNCRKGCGACCIYISITSPLPNHPNGKKAGEYCLNLSKEFTCSLWNKPNLPEICRNFQADVELCGLNSEEAKINIIKWEELTCIVSM